MKGPAVVKPGETLEGRYKILRAIDEGGMGSVFLAEHVLIKRKLAVKVMRPELAADADVVERFMNEARAAGTLGHPNIVESTDMGFTRDGVPYIVFEFLEGSLLTDEVYRLGGLTVRRALRIGAQIASALHAAHSAGIIHRDLKSENVFLTHKEDVTDHVKVLDFGISRFLEAESDRSGPGGQVMGTPEFMAPEQITDPDDVDKRADIYALGVIMYEMLTAKRPFRNDADPTAVLHQVLHELPPPLDIPNAPPGLLEMITEKLLAKDRTQRYDTMKEVQGALEAFNTVTTPTPVSITIPKELSEPRPAAGTPRALEPPAKPKKLWPIVAVLGLAAAAGGGFVVLRSGGSSAAASATTASATDGKKTVTADAEKIGSMLESEAHGAKLRAEGIAGTPMLRAAIETDAATLHDMIAGKDLLFTPGKNETLAVFQTQGGALVPMVRVPETAPEIPPLDAGKSRIQTDGTQLTISASVAIQRQSSGVGGVAVIATTIDLSSLQRDLAAHATRATVTGLARPLVLVNGPDDAAHQVSVPIPGTKELAGRELTLVAVPRR